MNFQCHAILKPLKVFVTNPLAPASQLIIVKIMSGVVFGNDQLIDLNLIVYSNEIVSANAFMFEIESCAFSCTNSIKVSSDLPSVDEGDVYCFLTNFNNPNHLDFIEKEFKEQFDAFYLIIKLANSFAWPDDSKQLKVEHVKTVHFDKKETKPTKTTCNSKNKPIFITDGLVAMDILKSLSENMPSDIFFCSTPITAIAKSVLADYLNVQCKVINDVLVWAASDEVFHVEAEKPLTLNNVLGDSLPCYHNLVSKDFLESRNLDTTQFSASWMKKEFIEKVATSASKNPYGCIYRAAEFSKTLRDIWLTRTDDGTKVYTNIGVISDGSLGTIKGLPYVLPVMFEKGTWNVDIRFFHDTHVKQEIKRINKAVKVHHEKQLNKIHLQMERANLLIPCCKKFLKEHVIQQDLKGEDVSISMY